MAEESVVAEQTGPSANGAAPELPSGPEAVSESKRERSTIEFPYSDLNDAVSVAKAIHQNWGQSCTHDQLAAVTGHETIGGGAYRLKVSTARIFGLIETTRDLIALTALGREVVNPEREPQARVRAFLNVPLYKALFEAYRGCPLPRNIALENEMVRLGVSQKQKEKARQVFQRSAEQAGFFAHGRDRLVMPAGVPAGDPGATTPPRDDSGPRGRSSFGGGGGGSGPGGASAGGNPGGAGFTGVGGAGGSGGGNLHPFIQGLLLTLPPPGAPWPDEKRQQWLDTARQIFGLLYPDSEE